MKEQRQIGATYSDSPQNGYSGFEEQSSERRECYSSVYQDEEATILAAFDQHFAV